MLISGVLILSCSGHCAVGAVVSADHAAVLADISCHVPDDVDGTVDDPEGGGEMQQRWNAQMLTVRASDIAGWSLS